MILKKLKKNKKKKKKSKDCSLVGQNSERGLLKKEKMS